MSVLDSILAAGLPDQGDRAVDLLRLSWLLLGLTALGVLGVILLAVFRRAYLRTHPQRRSRGGPTAMGPEADAWSESGRRMQVEPRREDPGADA